MDLGAVFRKSLKNVIFVEKSLKFLFFLPSSPSILTKSNKTVVSARVSPRCVGNIFDAIFWFSQQKVRKISEFEIVCHKFLVRY